MKSKISKRSLLYVNSGSVSVKMYPWYNKKYVSGVMDDYRLEYKSLSGWSWCSVNEKMRSLELELKEGMMLYIPCYWLYALKSEEMSLITNYSYDTMFSLLSQLPRIIKQNLQKQNIKRITLNKAAKEDEKKINQEQLDSE